jgi:hypothetical protein
MLILFPVAGLADEFFTGWWSRRCLPGRAPPEEVPKVVPGRQPAMLAGLRLVRRAETASETLPGEDLWTLHAVSRLVEFLTARSSRQPCRRDSRLVRRWLEESCRAWFLCPKSTSATSITLCEYRLQRCRRLRQMGVTMSR